MTAKIPFFNILPVEYLLKCLGMVVFDVNSKTAKKVNVSAKTVQRARAYVKAVKEKPEKYAGKTVTSVLNDIKSLSEK